MTDPTAIPLNAPEGGEGLITKTVEITWFDGTSKHIHARYAADQRLVALAANQVDGAPTLSVYGATLDGITTREVDGVAKRLVSGHWLLGLGSGQPTLLAQAMAQFLPMLDNAAGLLRIDDRAMLGVLEAPAALQGEATDPLHWSVAVVGELTVPGPSEQLVLRPSLVTRAGDSLSFDEPGVGAQAGDDNRLTVRVVLEPDPAGAGWRVAGDGAAALPAVALRAPVALLLDEKIDGAWERGAPLWLAGRAGVLRIDEAGAAASAPYRFSSETRACGVARWFPALGAGVGARLMLDQSGAKRLRVRKTKGNGRLELTLTIDTPALVFVLPRMALDGRGLRAPSLPPGPRAWASAAGLQLVPAHLCGERAPAWSLRHGAAGTTLHWQPPAAGGLTYFTASGNWVRPPEAAVNDDAGVSAVRALMPLAPPPGKALAFGLRADAAGAGVLIDVGDEAYAMAADEATALGPLARFAVDGASDREQWPGLAEESTPEPAVLRAAYRSLSAGLASDGLPASFDATRVRRGKATEQGDEAAQPLAAGDGAAGRGWARRAGSATPYARSEHRTNWPGDAFGWGDGTLFQRAALLRAAAGGDAAGAAAPDPALAWGQVGAGPAYAPVQWVRLSDDSLADIALPAQDSAQRAWAALVAEPLVLRQATLFDTDAGNPPWGLAHLALVEAFQGGASLFSLTVGGAAAPLIGPVQLAGTNRVVLASAAGCQVDVGLAPAVHAVLLNRVYLELERRGGRMVVVRGMLGWGADRAFEWPLAGAEFHVTELFERDGDTLRRAVEFNGVLSRQIDTAKVDLYFWDAVLKEGAHTLRVICQYRFDEHKTVCALQDAALVGQRLDLSADIAILGTVDGTDMAARGHPWQPGRRNLYRFQFDLVADQYEYAGFLRVRAAPQDKVDQLATGEDLPARVVPAWYLCDDDLVSWFADGGGARPPERASWTGAGLLRTGLPQAHGPEKIRLSLHLRNGVNYGLATYASTLIGVFPQGAGAGLPKWVPSPVRKPLDAGPGAAAGDPLFRLWLLNPGPVMVAQWAGETAAADAEPAVATTRAMARARQCLWRMGWTREAVLQIPPADIGGRPAWVVVDSPLLNRGASVAWFGWPLSPAARYPHEDLPLSAQVPQSSRAGQLSYSLQVEFERDRRDEERRPLLVRDDGAPAGPAPQGMTFHAGGMRAGVHHKLVVYGADETLTAHAVVNPHAQARPGAHDGEGLTVAGTWLSWWSDQIELGGGLVVHPDNVIEYRLSQPGRAVWIGGAPADAQWAVDPKAFEPIVDGERIALADAGTATIWLKLPAAGRWGPLSIGLRPTAEPKDEATVTDWLFPEASNRLVGVFDTDDRLLAFGEERLRYVAPVLAAGATGTRWTRVAGVELATELAERAQCAVSIDLDGRSVVSRRARA